MRIIEINQMGEKLRHLPLLLDADPSEAMVMRYLPRGRMFLLERDDPDGSLAPEQRAVGELVVVEVGGGRCEIKNLAVASGQRGQGFGSLLVEHAASVGGESCAELIVGTSEAGLDFYTGCGFRYSHREPGFFTRNYPEPIYENGQQCVDMLYLRRNLRQA